MIGPVQPTPYDLDFSLLGIPVRVSPWFWLMAVMLGWGATQLGMQFLGLWVLAVFVSILWHEFGHALAARSLGYSPHVLLYQFGGLAMYAPTSRFTLMRSLLITAAGPGAGFVLAGLVWTIRELLIQYRVEVTLEVIFFVKQMLYINLFWSAMNLLPVVPLDGGQICRDLLLMYNPRTGVTRALQIGVVVGAGIAIWAFTAQETYIAIMFAILAAGSWRELQQRGQGW